MLFRRARGGGDNGQPAPHQKYDGISGMFVCVREHNQRRTPTRQCQMALISALRRVSRITLLRVASSGLRVTLWRVSTLLRVSLLWRVTPARLLLRITLLRRVTPARLRRVPALLGISALLRVPTLLRVSLLRGIRLLRRILPGARSRGCLLRRILPGRRLLRRVLVRGRRLPARLLLGRVLTGWRLGAWWRTLRHTLRLGLSRCRILSGGETTLAK